MSVISSHYVETFRPRTLNRSFVKLATMSHERESAFKLVYSSYLKANLIEPNPHRMRVTPYHLLDTTSVFVSMVNGKTAGTVSLVGDGELGVPMESIFPEEIQKLRDQGVSFAEVSCLANRCEDTRQKMKTFIGVNRLMAQFARWHGYDKLVIAVHPRHARYYRRVMGFQELTTEERSYPAVCNKPAIAGVVDFEELDQNPCLVYDELFGTPASPHEFISRPMPEWERRKLATAVDYSGEFVPLAG